MMMMMIPKENPLNELKNEIVNNIPEPSNASILTEEYRTYIVLIKKKSCVTRRLRYHPPPKKIKTGKIFGSDQKG